MILNRSRSLGKPNSDRQAHPPPLKSPHNGTSPIPRGHQKDGGAGVPCQPRCARAQRGSHESGGHSRTRGAGQPQARQLKAANILTEYAEISARLWEYRQHLESTNSKITDLGKNKLEALLRGQYRQELSTLEPRLKQLTQQKVYLEDARREQEVRKRAIANSMAILFDQLESKKT